MAQPPPTSSSSQPTNPTVDGTGPPQRRTTQEERTRRQAGLFFGGAVFVLISSIITRRAVKRRYNPLSSSLGVAPSTHQAAHPSAAATSIQSQAQAHTQTPQGALAKSIPKPGDTQGAAASSSETTPPPQSEAEAAAAQLDSSGPILAVEALTVATLNVFSWALMLLGGALWYLDIGDVEDLRRLVRGGLGADGTGRTEREVEEEVEEWVASVLARKEEKDRVKEVLAQEKGGGVLEQAARGWRNERGRER